MRQHGSKLTRGYSSAPGAGQIPRDALRRRRLFIGSYALFSLAVASFASVVATGDQHQGQPGVPAISWIVMAVGAALGLGGIVWAALSGRLVSWSEPIKSLDATARVLLLRQIAGREPIDDSSRPFAESVAQGLRRSSGGSILPNLGLLLMTLSLVVTPVPLVLRLLFYAASLVLLLFGYVGVRRYLAARRFLGRRGSAIDASDGE